MQKIAVIGMSCLFPGAHTPEQFIRNLNQEVDSTSLHSKAQMGVDPSLFYSPRKGQQDKYYSKRGGYITDFKFNASGFELDEAVLSQLDDVYQWSLYVAREALVNGGYFADREKRNSCGVIMGNLSFPTKLSNQLYLPVYQQAIESVTKELLQTESLEFKQASDSKKIHPFNSRISGYPSAIVAQALGLSELFFSLDAACASSLYAVKLACDYLNAGKADLMLAGAVSAGDPFFINQGFSTFTAYSENDISYPLDKRSEGLISGEGAGMLLLKRYEDAVKDNDTIHAVISAIGLSNDGRGRSVLSPDSKGQLLAYERAYQNADIQPNQVDYLECHATGTPVGDPVEMESLDTFFGKHNAAPLIGVVKSNFGHLLTCAGMASMIKVIMSMSQSEIPATINLEQPISSPKGVITSDQIVQQLQPWPKRADTKIGAVNAFGFGGTNAHLILEAGKSLSKTPKKTIQKTQPMAIVGMEACFGPFKNLQAFDQGIYSGKQGFVKLPERRWKGLEEDSLLLKSFNIKKESIPTGAYLDNFDFDTLRYKIPPNEIDSIMPQQLLMLKVADQAVRDAGLREGSNVSVIVAMESEKSLHQFRGRIDLDWLTDQALLNAGVNLSEVDSLTLKNVLKDSIRKPVQVNEFTSFIGNIMASRVSALWDFTGPSFTVSAEDNSVYKALEIAQMLLDNNETDAVVVGAVDLAGNFEDLLIRNRYEHRYSVDPVSLGIDEGTNGFKVGEGAGAVVLKSLDKARKDNKRCYATIDTISLNKKSSSEAVQESYQEALTKIQNGADDIGLLEISGVGKEEQLLKGLGRLTPGISRNNCAIGSVVANIGHTYSASGMASLVKSALCLFHRYIPAVPNWKKPKADLLENNSSLYFPTNSRYWATESGSRRIATIAGFGSDDSFAQVMLAEETSPKKRSNRFFEQEALFMFPVVAENKEAMNAALSALEEKIFKADNLYRFACVYQAEVKASPEKPYRAVIVGSGKEAIRNEISLAEIGIANAFMNNSEWQSPNGSYFTADPLASEGNLALVYPGAYNSYVGMGRDTYRMFPDLMELMQNYSKDPEKLLHDRLLMPRSQSSLSDSDYKDFQSNLETAVIPSFESGIQFAILQTALLRGAFGIRPKSAFGYSMGEVSMGFALGLWDNTDQMSETLHTSPLFLERLAGPMYTAREDWNIPPGSKNKDEKIWSSFVVQGPVNEIAKSISTHDKVYLLLVNSPNEAIIGGQSEACKQYLKKAPFNATPATLNNVIHCQLVEKERQLIYEMQNSPVVADNNIRFYTAASYNQTSQTNHDLAENIANIYCKTLDFPKLVNQVYEDGSRIFLEVGPRANCSKWIGEILEGRDHLALSLDNKGTQQHQALFKALAKLYSHGVDINFSAIYPARDGLGSGGSKTMAISPGGAKIADSILTKENREQFKPEIQEPKPDLVAYPMKPAARAVNFSAEQEIQTHRSHVSQVHSAFLTTRDASLKHLREMIKLKMILTSDQPVAVVGETKTEPFKGDPYFYPETRKLKSPSEVIWDEADLLEFAGGRISNVFGKEYEIIDTYKYRVQLPLPPYLLVNRVTKLNAKRGEFKPSSMTTEYDIAEDAWFSMDGQIPWAIASEAGQCDLLLISYLGIDFQSKGLRYYRLTDYTMTFFDELPKAGQTLRYDIKIESFIRSGEALFFNFGYDCYVKEKLVYRMTGGRAGFISDEELAQGKGVVLSKAEEKQRLAINKSQFTPLLKCQRTAFSRDDLLNITKGNIAACLGPPYNQLGLNPSLRFAAEEILMLDRIVSIDTTAGPWGLGEVVAEKDLAPDHWYFPCHFKDDNVLAGTLVTEGCVQLLGFYMLYLGLQVNTKDARFQPIKNQPYGIRARGQILPSDSQFTYKMEIIEIGLEPRPFAKANFYIIMNGKTLVDFRDLGVELLEKSPTDPAYRGLSEIQAQFNLPSLYGPEVIEEFATGSLARVFGPEFEIYRNKRGPRTPNGDLKMVSRIKELSGEPGNFKTPSTLTAEYDVPVSVWFINQNSFPIAPYSIIMEIALQPCAFLSAYMKTTFSYPEAEMCFRNLSSTAELVYTPDLRGKTIENRIKMTSVSKAAETVVMNFDYELICEGNVFYKGETQFGYFTPHALSMQKGLDRGEKIPPWYMEAGLGKENGIRIDLLSANPRSQFFQAKPEKPFLRLAGDQLEFLDEATIFPNQGKFGQGYVFSCKKVNPADWFYPFHFYGDPVMPGSLGIEAILQSMKIFILQQNLGSELKSPRFVHVPGVTKCLYRGQITPDNETMDLEVHIKSIEAIQNQIVLKADANLWKNGLRIYQITDAAIALIGENR